MQKQKFNIPPALFLRSARTSKMQCHVVGSLFTMQPIRRKYIG